MTSLRDFYMKCSTLVLGVDKIWSNTDVNVIANMVAKYRHNRIRGSWLGLEAKKFGLLVDVELRPKIHMHLSLTRAACMMCMSVLQLY